MKSRIYERAVHEGTTFPQRLGTVGQLATCRMRVIGRQIGSFYPRFYRTATVVHSTRQHSTGIQ
jgi:hypothetical protein